MVVSAAIAAMLIASLAAPRAFGRDATTFAIAYLIGLKGGPPGRRPRHEPPSGACPTHRMSG